MNHRGIWVTGTVLAVIVLVAQIAGASTRDVSVPLAANAAVTTELTTATTAAMSLPEQASVEARGHADKAKANVEARENTTVEANENTTAPAAAPSDSTTGARPGWGCGDKNHTHSGPPGRPGATPPPGCAKK